MDNSDGSHSERLNKRPSARRPAADAEAHLADAGDVRHAGQAGEVSDAGEMGEPGEVTAKIPKRVHARRPVAAPEGTAPSSPPPAAESRPSRSSVNALKPPRASVRSARAGRESAPPSPVATPADVRVPPMAAPPSAAEEFEARTEQAEPAAVEATPTPSTEQGAGAREAEGAASPAESGAAASERPAPELPVHDAVADSSAAAGLVWHSDAAAPGPSRSAELLGTPMASALARADFADDFGLDAGYEAKLRPWLEALCQRYLHVEVLGAQHIPAQGRALLVANHSRSALWDGIVLRTALRLHHESGREPRWLVDDQQYHAPFLGTFVNRLGAVRACQENAERLLLREELVAVFPEGAKAAERRFEDRYRLQRFGRGGYVKLALRTGAPVIPVAIVAHDRDYATWLSRLSSASRLLSTPMLALRPGLPRFGRLGVPPIASHIQICIGEPVREIARAGHDALAVRDDGLVHELNECVRGAVQQLVNASLHG